LKRLVLLALLLPCSLRGQDTTQAYPWRLSYFPYVTASPDNGVMLMGRAVLFEQSRWDARTSVDKQVAIEGGYSTDDAWVVRLRLDMPKLAPGWRVQALAEATRQYFAARESDGYRVSDSPELWSRQSAEFEVTRTVAGPLLLAARGGWVRATSVIEEHPEDNETQTEERGRIGLVIDLRDREYDTRSGALLQGGFIVGSSNGTYRGGYALAAGWLPLGARTRITARGGYRAYGVRSGTPDAWRTIPAWEDEFVVGGGAESDRALPPGFAAGRRVMLASAEVRHDVKVFPGGALTLLAFVDGARTGLEFTAFAASPGPSVGEGPLQDWAIGAGGGVALRLLRNAILTGTIARAEGATRVYVSSGWSW
jgi:hypothetical protein